MCGITLKARILTMLHLSESNTSHTITTSKQKQTNKKNMQNLVTFTSPKSCLCVGKEWKSKVTNVLHLHPCYKTYLPTHPATTMLGLRTCTSTTRNSFVPCVAWSRAWVFLCLGHEVLKKTAGEISWKWSDDFCVGKSFKKTHWICAIKEGNIIYIFFIWVIW